MPNSKPEVTVVGAGMAGLTAALCLADRGYKVTVYERQPFIGGNLGAYEWKGTPRDVYPHMFTNWYLNFWQLVDFIGLSKKEHFKSLSSFKFLREGDFPNLKTLSDAVSIRAAVANLCSGLAPAPDIFLWAYSIVDLLSQRFDLSELLNRESVNGFICSRPYATNRMAQLHDDFIQSIWAVHSYLTSAAAYQDYLKYQVRHPNPQSWVLKGTTYDTFMGPLRKKLEDLKCDVRTSTQVNEVFVRNGKVVKIKIGSGDDYKNISEVEVENLILAVPAKFLARLIQGQDAPMKQEVHPREEQGKPEFQHIIDVLPELAPIRRLYGEPIPVLNLYFNKKLDDIPEEYVALLGSRFGLTFVSVPTKTGFTALTVAASDFYALPDYIEKVHPFRAEFDLDLFFAFSGPQRMPVEDSQDAYTVLEELHRFLPVFELGKSSNDKKSDVDWGNCSFYANVDHELYINEVGGEQWSVNPHYEELPNLFFAGDFCESNIEITCVEAAVVSGLEAAETLRKKDKIGSPIVIARPEAFSPNFMALVKLGLAPYAFGAKVWSMGIDFVEKVKQGEIPVEPIAAVSDLVDAVLKPYSVAVELCRSVRQVFAGDKKVDSNHDTSSGNHKRRARVKR